VSGGDERQRVVAVAGQRLHLRRDFVARACLDQRGEQDAPGGGERRVHVQRVAASFDGALVIAREIPHPRGARGDHQTQRIQNARAIRCRRGFRRPPRRGEKAAVKAVRRLAARVERERALVGALGGGPVPLDNPIDLRQRQMRVGQRRVELERAGRSRRASSTAARGSTK
jgi:hypothetical protein